MDYVSATVHLSANRNFAIPKANLSVAEVVLLRRLHGEDAVVNVRKERSAAVHLGAERKRLMDVYGAKKDVAKIISDIFQNIHLQGIERVSDLADVQTSDAIEARKSVRASVAKAVSPDELQVSDGEAQGAAQADGDAAPGETDPGALEAAGAVLAARLTARKG
jgi:hypothetical protein